MKHPIRNYLRRVLPLAVPPVLGAVLFAIFVPGFTGPESSMLQRVIYIVVVIGGGFAGILSLLLGSWGLVFGYGFPLLIALPQALPEPWNRYYSMVYLVFLFAAPRLIEKIDFSRFWKKQKFAALSQDDEEELFTPDHIFVLRSNSDRVYQLVRCSGQLRAYLVGRELRGIDECGAVNPAEPRKPGKKDLCIPLDAIRSVSFREHNTYGSTVKIKTEGKSYGFHPYVFTSPEELEAFCRRNLPQAPAPVRHRAPDSATQSRRETLKKVKTVLCIALALVILPFMFLQVPYRLFSTLLLLLGCAVIAMICLFPGDIGFEESKQNPSGRIDMAAPLLFVTLIPLLRTFLDFDFLDLMPVLYWALGIGIPCFLLVIFRNPIFREKTTTVIAVAILLLAFGAGAAGQLNYLLDREPIQTQSATVTNLFTSSGSRGGTYYNVDVKTSDGEVLNLTTYEELYESLSVGDPVTVYTAEGALGIPWASLS